MKLSKKTGQTVPIATTLVLVSVLLSACGGSDEGSAPPSRFEGALEVDSPGNTTNSFLPLFPPLNEFSAIALEDGTLWFTFPSSGVGQAKFTAGVPILNAATGKAVVYEFIGTDVFFANAPPSANPPNARFGYSFRVLDESPNALPPGFEFEGLKPNFYYPRKPIPTDRYRYDRPAFLADIAGTWGQNLSISATGVITGAAAVVKVGGGPEFTGAFPTPFPSETTTTCGLTGSATPRPSGKNVFNVNLNASGNGCAIAGQSYTGVAVPYIDKTNAPRLQIMTLNAGKNSYASLSLQR